MSPGFNASWAWIRACSSAAFLAFSMASFMKVAAWEGWIVLPMGRRSDWDEEEILGCRQRRNFCYVSVPAHPVNSWNGDHGICPVLPAGTCGVGGLMKLSCFFLSSICRVAASIICLICGKRIRQWVFRPSVSRRAGVLSTLPPLQTCASQLSGNRIASNRSTQHLQPQRRNPTAQALSTKTTYSSLREGKAHIFPHAKAPRYRYPNARAAASLVKPTQAKDSPKQLAVCLLSLWHELRWSKR